MLLVSMEINIDGIWFKKPLTILNNHNVPYTVDEEHPLAIVTGYAFTFNKDDFI